MLTSEQRGGSKRKRKLKREGKGRDLFVEGVCCCCCDNWDKVCLLVELEAICVNSALEHCFSIARNRS